MWNVGENQEFGFGFQTPGSFLSDDRLAIPLVKNEDVAVSVLHILCKLRIYHNDICIIQFILLLKVFILNFFP